jgi:PAS domain-containing protein
MLLPRTTGETVEGDLDWFFRRDGSMFPVSYVSAPIDMPEGRGAVVAFTDIEDRLRAEQVLREHDAILATEQDALRRVATLVAGARRRTRSSPPWRGRSPTCSTFPWSRCPAMSPTGRRR